MSWLVVGMWVGTLALVVGLLVFVSSPHKGTRSRGSFSVNHLLILQSVWEPGKRHVYEQRQVQHEDGDEEGGPPKPGADDEKGEGGAES